MPLDTNADNFESTVTEERDRRPRFGYTADTHRYWHSTVSNAYERLKIQERAQKAKKNKEWITYDLKGKSVNLVTQKLVAKSVNIITDYPEITPRFREQDDELQWFDIVTSLVKRDWEDCDAKAEFVALLWDNFSADIAWGKISFETQFSPGQIIKPANEKQVTIQQETQIQYEHAMCFQGTALTVGPQDMHELHIQRHEDMIRELSPMVEAGAVPAAIMQLLELHLADHRQARSKTDRQRVVYQRWPSYLVYYDPTALRWQDCEWYALEFVERRQTLIDSKMLRNVSRLTGQIRLEDDPYHERGHTGDISGGSGDPPEETHIRYWLIHSRIDSQMIIIAQQEDADQLPLLVADWPYPGDIVHPFVLNQVNDQVHGVSEIDRMAMDNAQIEALDKKMMTWARNVPVAKRLVKKKYGNDKSFMRKFNDPEQVNVEVDTSEDKLVETVEYPSIDAGIYQRYQMLDDRMNQTAGTPNQAQASAGDSGKATATEITSLDRQFGATVQMNKSRLADHIRWVCSQIIDIWRENGTVDQLIRVVGDRSRLHWEQFTPADIPYEISWGVDTDSLAPTDRELAKKQTMEALEAFMPFIQMGIVDPIKLLVRAMRRLGFVEDPYELLAGQNNNPMMAGAMMAGQQMMQPQMGQQQQLYQSYGQPPTQPALPAPQETMDGQYAGAQESAAMAM